MTIDELINNTLKSGNEPLDTTGLLAVVSDVHTRQLFILELQDYFSKNIINFSKGIPAFAVLMGIYSGRELAENCIATLREVGVQSPGFLNLPGWHLLAGDAVKNELHTLPLRDYNINCLAFLHYHIDTGSMPLAIFSNEAAADAGIDYIRYTIREKNR